MKKVAFLTHSFHKKTKSANIYAEEIFDKKNFLVDYYYIEFTELGLALYDGVIEGYDVVVIVQLISLEILSKIKCDNIIFIPMYDMSVSWDALKWLECASLKILSPTKQLHDSLCQLGLNSFHIKYYPEPDDFMPGDLTKIFLWQRVNVINIKTTLKLLTYYPVKQIHLHKAIDPYHVFVEPSLEEFEKYNIVFSDWFEERQQYLDIIKETGIYIAPRIMEGGASAFIDAMKMGKIVIAHNDAAMNEYIVHNETGFLYDVNNVEPINFDTIDLALIQKNAYQSVREGRLAWRKSIPGILNFIATKSPIFIPNTILKVVQDKTELLKMKTELLEKNNILLSQTNKDLFEEKKLLEERLTRSIHENTQLKNEPWHIFGKLSKKDKFINLFKMAGKEIMGFRKKGVSAN